jgi:ABC-type uncharacterized transport system involved in gliding motility auxiliary subunit
LPTKKGRIWTGLNATVLTLAVAGILVFVNLIAARHFVTPFDCTAEGRFTLSPQTTKVLQSLTEDVQATVFLPLGDPDRDEVQKMLDLYRAVTPRFKVRMIDPDRNSLLTEEYVRKYGAFDPGTIIFESGTESAKVKGLERDPFSQSVRYADEESILNALVKVRQKTRHKVCFLTGHEERNIEGEGEDGYSQAAEALRAQNYVVAGLNLAETGAVPGECSVLVIAGPKTPLLEGETGMVKKYLDEGGRVLCMIDPGAPLTGLDAILREWKIKSPDLMVVDLLTRLLGVDPFTAVAVEFSDHEITKDFRTANLFFPHARPVLLEEDQAGDGTELLKTGKSSWAESDLNGDSIEFNEGKDMAGPLSLAVAEEKTVQNPAAEGAGGKTGTPGGDNRTIHVPSLVDRGPSADRGSGRRAGRLDQEEKTVRTRSTALALLVLAGLALFYYLYEIRGGRKREAIREEQKRVLPFREAGITSVEIRRGESPAIRIDREGADRYRIVEPVETRSDSGAVDSLLFALAGMTSERVVEENAARLGEYGLDTPSASVVVKGTTGSSADEKKDGTPEEKGKEKQTGTSEVTLLFGKKHPIEPLVYAMKKASPAVFLVRSSVLDALDKSLFDFRDKKVLAFDRQKVDGILLEGRALPAEIVIGKAGDRWALESPVKFPADTDKINSLLDSLEWMRAKSFEEERAGDLSRYGLASPEVSIVIRAGGADYRLDLGSPKAGAVDTIFARSNLTGAVVTVDAKEAGTFTVSPEALERKKLADFEYFQPVKIELERPDSPLVVLAKDDKGDWKMLKPEEAPAKWSAVDSLLSTIRSAEARKVLTTDLRPRAFYGLDRPALRVRVFLKGAAEPEAFELGRAAGGSGGLYASVKGVPAVFQVDEKLLTDLTKKKEDFLE